MHDRPAQSGPLQRAPLQRGQDPLTVLSIAYPFAGVGPASVGGAEQILATVEAGLVAAGLRSVVVAQAGSQVAGTLLATPNPEGVFTDAARAETEAAHQANIDRALHRFPVHLVHMHGIDFHRYRLPAHIPVLVTLHLPPSWYPESIWSLPPHIHLQCVSQFQRQSCPEALRDRLPVIRNGVPMPPAGDTRKRSFALLLSRICPEKNLHVALDAARLARVPVLLAGQVFPYPDHLRYFEEQIRPRLGPHARASDLAARGSGPAARWLGPVGGPAKQRLLASARCLLLPTLAPETSSLVAIEALAAGTPVVAFPSGAIPEILEDGRTGLLVHDVPTMAAAILRASPLAPKACRTSARERFSATRMLHEYLALYASLTNRTLPGVQPLPAVIS